MNDKEWWKTSVFYQIYPRSFKDSNGDGVGDLPGILSKLNYLKDLGIDAIWLSPIYSSPMKDFGYDIQDYVAIDKIFGSMEDFCEIISTCKKLNMKVIMDLVINHTSDQHPWFLESKSSLNNPKRNWYQWSKSYGNNLPPNLLQSLFGESSWTLDKITSEYYFHEFLPEQPSLNLWNPQVVLEIIKIINFWIDKGVSGFRMDVVDLLIDDDYTLYDNSKLNIHDVEVTKNYSRQPETHILLKYLRKKINITNSVLIGELSSNKTKYISSFYGNNDEINLPFDFNLVRIPWDAAHIREHILSVEKTFPSYASPAYVLGNHDVNRIVSRIGYDQAKSAAILQLTLRGVPFIYYGDEIGMEDGILERSLDPKGKIKGIQNSRDYGRTPMQWDNSQNAGFSDAKPWLPINPNYNNINVFTELKDSNSILNVYKDIIKLRRNSQALLYGNLEIINVENKDIFCFMRKYNNETIIVAINFSKEFQQFIFKGIVCLYSSVTGHNVIIGNTQELNPLESRIFCREITKN